MTAFDWFMVAMFYLGYGHARFWRRTGNPGRWAMFVRMEGYRFMWFAYAVETILWPLL